MKIHLRSRRAEGMGSTRASLLLHPTKLQWRVSLVAAVAVVGWPGDASGDVHDDSHRCVHTMMSWAWLSQAELPHSPTGLTVVELE